MNIYVYNITKKKSEKHFCFGLNLALTMALNATFWRRKMQPFDLQTKLTCSKDYSVFITRATEENAYKEKRRRWPWEF